MMRRTTWLTVGAVLGVVGYRRLDRATRSLTGQIAPASAEGSGGSPARAGTEDAKASSALRLAAGLTARAAGWLSRHLRRSVSGERRSRGGLAAFARDVRVGIDEYLDRHESNIDRQYTRSGNTLVGQTREVRQRHHSRD
jgi:hypothetical protein